jgi:hypothetical protein
MPRSANNSEDGADLSATKADIQTNKLDIATNAAQAQGISTNAVKISNLQRETYTLTNKTVFVKNVGPQILTEIFNYGGDSDVGETLTRGSDSAVMSLPKGIYRLKVTQDTDTVISGVIAIRGLIAVTEFIVGDAVEDVDNTPNVEHKFTHTYTRWEYGTDGGANGPTMISIPGSHAGVWGLHWWFPGGVGSGTMNITMEFTCLD